MPQFPRTDDRQRVLEKIPDYAVAISQAVHAVVVKHDGLVIAESSNALLVEESRHKAVYYLPRSDVDMNLLTRTELSTYCPFKGHASYWSMNGNDQLENFVWSYEDPYPEVAEIKDTLSFYTDRVELIIA